MGKPWFGFRCGDVGVGAFGGGVPSRVMFVACGVLILRALVGGVGEAAAFGDIYSVGGTRACKPPVGLSTADAFGIRAATGVEYLAVLGGVVAAGRLTFGERA